MLPHIGSGRYHGSRARYPRHLPCELVGAAQVAGQDADDVLRPVVDHQHRWVGPLVLQERRNHAHHRAKRHDADEASISFKQRRNLRHDRARESADGALRLVTLHRNSSG